MGRNRFVHPDIVRLTLSDGDFVDIKKELTAGEYRHVFARLVKDMRAGEKVQIDPEKVGFTKIVEYVVGWSFADATGTPVEVNEGAINSLDQDTYAELSTAINVHENEVDAEREARKNATGGTLQSAAISPSVV